MTVIHDVELAAVPTAMVVVGAVVALTFTPELVSAWAVGAAGLVTGILAGVAAIITAWRTTRKVEENTAITQEVKAAVKTVEGHVNSAATASAAMIEALRKELADTRLQISKLEQVAALSTQASVIKDATSVSKSAAMIEAPEAQIHLEQIEANTKDTVVVLTDVLKDNTTETVAAVKDAIKEQP